MKTLTLCITTTLLALTTLCKPAETGAVPGEWTMDFETARRVADQKKLPIFINFTGSDWCVWCKHMEKEVFEKKAWQDYAKQSLMLVWIDFPKDKSLVPEKYRKRNEQLSALFEIKGYPSYVILDDNGKDQLGELKAEQSVTPEGFISKLKAVLIERDESMKKLIAAMSDKEGSELKSACDERSNIRKELNELQKREQQLRTRLIALDAEIKELRTKALVDKLTPAKASRHRVASKELKEKQKELNTWLATQPEQTEENRKKYSEMSEKISALEKQINGLLYAE